jgi:hypothetical protein
MGGTYIKDYHWGTSLERAHRKGLLQQIYCLPGCRSSHLRYHSQSNQSVLLSFVVLIALMWAISSAALSDKLPMAIRAIAKTISSHKHKGE